MRKILFAFLMIFLSLNTFAIEPDFNPMVAIGHRFGKDDLNDDDETYASFKITLLGHKLESFNKLNFFSPGVNLQTDGKLSLSIAPVSITMLNSLTLGLDMFFREKGVHGGNWGLFLGYRF